MTPLRPRGSHSKEIRNAGYYGHFWRGDHLYIAYNEGGYGPLAWNLRLKDGWLPDGIYIAVKIFGCWLRFAPGWRL